jgi:hypothetical protein
LLLFIDATLQSKSLKIGILGVLAAFTQLVGYGLGLITEVIKPRGNQPFSQK